MNKARIFFLCIFLYLPILLTGQSETATLDITIKFSNDIAETFQNDGRMFVFLSENGQGEPRQKTWPNPFSPTHIFARNMSIENRDDEVIVSHYSDWLGTTNWNFKSVPFGTYYVQALWCQNKEEGGINSQGNLYSMSKKIEFTGPQSITLDISEMTKRNAILENDMVRIEEFTSDTLSAWWGRPVNLKAAILLPAGHDIAKGPYAIRYNVAGFGGRIDRINRISRDKDFMSWWRTDEAPQIISVFLDGEGPFGDTYHMDSENSGPHGYALIHEFIPYLENKYRGTQDSQTRFVDGCSTGGWVSLGLQLYYPDHFNGVYSYSPDAVDFENYQLINIYRDENAYVNEFGYDRPVMRDLDGEPMISMKNFVLLENVLGSSGAYVTSGGQFGAHAALYSPKGQDGLPMPLFDPFTGQIDRAVAEHWKKYDFLHYARGHWEDLGPKIKDKIYIWMGDMDQFYLNPATRSFADFLQTTESPGANATVEFSPMEGHCSQYSHRHVLEQIQSRLDQIN